MSVWNATKFENVGRCINETITKFEKIRSLEPNSRNITMDLTKKLEDLLSMEENPWRKKSKEY